MATSKMGHTMHGEFVFDGIYMCSVFPRTTLERIKKRDFQLDSKDVLVVSYPKAGNAWVQEIVWLLKNDVNIEKAKTTMQEVRVPFLEFNDGKQINALDIIAATPPPRVIKSHLMPYLIMEPLMEANAKMVFLIRNIKDSLVSFYHFYRMNSFLGNYSGSFEQFYEELFKTKKLIFGDWFDMNLAYWKERDNPNVFFLKYEDLQRDFKGVVRRMATFLDTELTDGQLEALAEHTSFQSMRGNEQLNKTHLVGMNNDIVPYMRRGTVGGWKEYFTDDMNAYVDALYQEKILGTGLETEFTL